MTTAPDPPAALANGETSAPDESRAERAGEPELESLPARIVFFDGVCAFCDHAVRWLQARDPAGRFHFAPLQGDTAAVVRRHYPSDFPANVDTLVYVERIDGETRIHLRSEAVFRLCQELDGGWHRLAWLRALPRWLTDLGYRAFARSRYRVFGRIDACDIPTPAQRERLLP